MADYKREYHGGKGTRLYNIWKNMRQRCNNPKNPRYSSYGGRGINICTEWNSFTIFRVWAMSKGYSDTLSIDRIDNDGDYIPSNCRWADVQTQNLNQRDRKREKGRAVGVYLDGRNGIYQTVVSHKGILHYPGTARTVEDATRIRNEYISKHNLPNRRGKVEG